VKASNYNKIYQGIVPSV